MPRGTTVNLFRLLLPPLCLALLASGCATTKLPLLPISVPLPRINFLGGEERDYSRKDRDEAARRLMAHLRQEFPLAERKGIAWDSLEENLLARIAESDGDSIYYYALRDLAASLRDANVSLSESPKLLSEQFAGGYGLSLAATDDGRVFVTGVAKDGPAEKAGVLPMAEVIYWNGEPVLEAVTKAPVLWGGQPAATEARAFTRKLGGITRAPLDTKATITYRNPADVQTDAAITAAKETWSALQAESMLPTVTLDMRTILASKTLDGGVGYIRVDLFAPNMTTPFPTRAFRSALSGFVDSGAPALILDLRGTSAGLDEFAAEFAAHFLSEARPYRELEVYNDKTEAFERDPASVLSVSPVEPKAPPTFLLVDGQTARAAETFAWTLQQAGAAVVVGESKTRGVTNVPDRTVKLPGGHTFTYPIGRWIAPDGTTPVEPDAVGEGGVTPDIKIPITQESLRSSVLEKRDTALEYLQSHIAQQQPQ